MGRWFKRILVGVSVLAYMVFVIKKLFPKKQNYSDSEIKHDKTIVQGMRIIENPFDEKDSPSQEQANEVVVKNEDYNGCQVYKYDILVTVGIVFVMLAVIIVSLFAYNSRIEKDNAQMLETIKTDSVKMHTLDEIKLSVGIVADRLDSLDAHLKDGTKAMSEWKESIEYANKKKGKK